MGPWLGCLVLACSAAAPAAADATLGGFDLTQLGVERELVVAGGPGRDGIKSVDEPRVSPLGEVHWVAPENPVIGVVLGGEARAYPVHLLEWHQVVNDELAGSPLLVSYDPIAGAPRAYRRRLGERTLRFGVSGLLYNSNFLLYDRETESLWSQWDGRAIAGPMLGKALEPVGLRQDPLAAWLARQPDTTVLDRPMPLRIDYRYSPFKGYWVEDRVPFPVRARDERFHAKEVVAGVVVKGRARAYLGSVLTARGGFVEEEFEGAEIRVAYDTNTATFDWEVPDEVALREAYWFAWKAWHPDTGVWGDAPP